MKRNGKRWRRFTGAAGSATAKSRRPCRAEQFFAESRSARTRSSQSRRGSERFSPTRGRKKAAEVLRRAAKVICGVVVRASRGKGLSNGRDRHWNRHYRMPANRPDDRRHGDLFINRVYTDEEIRYCQNRKQATQHYAGRWAAKEAILKALGTGWIRGIQLARHRNPQRPQRPRCRAVRGGTKEVVERLGVAKLLVPFPIATTRRPTRSPRPGR